jgi:hypothetical protein
LWLVLERTECLCDKVSQVMSHRKDLSRYSNDDANLLNVGWLDRNEIFPRGETSQEFRDALTEHIRYSVVQTLGRHRCNLCSDAGHEVRIKLAGGGLIHLGSCEIRVFAENGIIYAAPNLVYHYVMDCEYLPPEPFVEAVIKSPRPPSDDYIALLARRSANWLSCPLVEMVSGKPIWMPPRFCS